MCVAARFTGGFGMLAVPVPALAPEKGSASTLPRPRRSPPALPMSGFWAKGPTATTTSAATSLNVHTGKISVVGGKRAGSNNKAPAAVPQHEGTQGKSVHGWERPGGITNKSASAANVPAAPCCLGTQNTTHGRAQSSTKLVRNDCTMERKT
eukprot:1150935-Pelagomonas_calceolata.AAC.21